MRAFNANDYFKFLVVFSLMLLAGCAENAYTVQKGMTDAVETATLRDIRVTGDGAGARIEIDADRPLTYTSYSDSDPRRLVLDISNADPGTAQAPQLDPSLLVKKVDVVKTDLTAGSLVRITMEANDAVDYVVNSNPANMSSITVVANPRQPAAEVSAGPAAAQPAQEQSAVVAQEPVPTASTDAGASVSTAASPAPLSGSGPSLADIAVVSDGIDIRTNAPVRKYKYFNMTKPQRLVVDLYGFKSDLSRTINVNAFGIENARIGSYADKTRIVFDSTAEAFPSYTLDKSTSGLKLNLQKAAALAGSPVPSPEPMSTHEQPVAATSGQAAIEAIDFKVVDGVSRIQVTVAGSCTMSQPAQTANGLMLTFKSCLLPKSLQRPFDTGKFDSVVKNMTPYQVTTNRKPDAKINVTLRESAPYTVSRDGSVITVEITNPQHYAVASSNESPQLISSANTAVAGNRAGNGSLKRDPALAPTYPQKSERGLQRKEYTGKRVTLEFADADIRKIFQLIGEVSNLNILVGDDVTGTISLKLVNVPWDQALDVILDTKNLAMKRTGNIVVIRPRDKMTTQADEEVAARKAYEKTLDMQMKVFEVNYADVKDVATHFANYKSERGTISTDARTNRVIVHDIAPALEKMAFLIKELDMPEKQVLIEARIVEASSDFSRDLGIQWAAHYDDSPTATMDAGFGGSVTNLIGAAGFAASGGALGMSLGKLAEGFQLDMRLQAMETATQGKIISTPKILTLNNKPAKISQGTMQPYQTVSSEGTKTEFVEATLKLEVTPHIMANGNVIMKIKATNDDVQPVTAGTAPPINKKEATTEMVVKNGETTVIGGIYKDSETLADDGVPWLMDIPVLGWLFKSNTKTKRKSELLIFVTPRIVE
jgi:type IV pilus assembly protein PilQ